MKSRKVNTLKLNDPNYPDILKHIDKPPDKLNFIGAHPEKWLDKPRLAIVGSRKSTGYGRAVTEDLTAKLASADVVIISGLAYGTDAYAHQTALKAGGITVAVLPTPVTKLYPPGHRQLADTIISSGGTLISEYDEDSVIYRSNFLQRNRIISGLADAVLIPEAALKSGSLATARFGMEQGRTVMAVPGNINSLTSAGCNNLIKAGALPVTEVEDIYFALGITPTGPVMSRNFRGTTDEERILELIKSGVISQEELGAACGLDGAAINNALTMLEIAGVIRPHGNGNWAAS